MTRIRANQFAFLLPISLGIGLLLSNIKTCQPIPELYLELSTDTIEFLLDNEYKFNGSVSSFGENEVIQHGFCYALTSRPTVTGMTTQLGNRNLIGNFTSTISTVLFPKTIYYVRAYATTSAGTRYGNELKFTTKTEPVIDIDGNVYQTIQIGEQVWMAENLKTTRYSDSTSIQLVEETSEWDNLTSTSSAYCWYNNDYPTGDINGALYTWTAAMNGNESNDLNPSGIQGVCPTGWHLPSDAEWKELEMHLGMNTLQVDSAGWRGNDEGGKLKEDGFAHWHSPNKGATNTSGFSAFPGGLRNDVGTFTNLGSSAYFTTATQYSSTLAWYRVLWIFEDRVHRNVCSKFFGLSVRCVQD